MASVYWSYVGLTILGMIEQIRILHWSHAGSTYGPLANGFGNGFQLDQYGLCIIGDLQAQHGLYDKMDQVLHWPYKGSR